MKILFTSLFLLSQLVTNYNQEAFWIIDNPTIEAFNNQFISADELINKLIDDQQLQKIDYLYANYIDNIYENNYMVIGIYDVQVELTILNEDSPIINATIKVIAPETEEEPIAWHTYLLLFFKKLFQKIIDFFL